MRSVATVLVTLDGTGLSILLSQCWLTGLARRIPKNNIGEGVGKQERDILGLVVKCHNYNLTRTVDV